MLLEDRAGWVAAVEIKLSESLSARDAKTLANEAKWHNASFLARAVGASSTRAAMGAAAREAETLRINYAQTK